ncbi:MAG: hypothetical protein QM722_03840 [Piscinibacter sp.]
MRTDIRRRSLVAALALGLGGLMVAWVGGMPAPHDAGVASVGVAALTLRQAADALAARYQLRIVIDPAVRGDTPAPFDPNDASLPLETQLQRLFAGHELLLHHTADRGSGARLVAAWVFARAEDVSVAPRPTAALAATTTAPTIVAAAMLPAAAPAAPRSEPGRGLHDADEQVRLQALQSSGSDTPPASPHELRRLVENDPSEAVRLQALEALAAHPESGEAELRQLIEQLAANPYTLLGEQARALREARQASLAGLTPEPIDSPP